MNIPEQVIKEAGNMMEQYGGNLEYLGDVDGQKAWLPRLPDDLVIGFPFLYLYKDGEAIEITGPSVFDFIGLYVKDVEEVEVE